jgi:hypothetical protein
MRKQAEKFSVDEVNPQETDSISSGSSETLRKTANPFDFTTFVAVNLLAQNRLISDLEWFVGFSEGDDRFIVNKTGHVSFQVMRSRVDVQVLYRVRQILGFGTVSEHDPKNQTWCFRVRGRVNLRKVIALFNGNLVLDKNQNRFSSFVAAFNARYKENIEVVNARPAATLKSAWLSGFTDAKGCFIVSVTSHVAQKKPYQVHISYSLAQKNAEEELRALAALVNGKVCFLKSYGGHNLSVQLMYLKVLLRYFRVFPLKTIKRVALVKFLAVYRKVLENARRKHPLSSDELEAMKKRAKEINKIEGFADDKVRPTK